MGWSLLGIITFGLVNIFFARTISVFNTG
ncbi:MAG: hypothetical protein ACLTTJ_14425 [Blautia sp.]